jgi:hypothetical protein
LLQKVIMEDVSLMCGNIVLLKPRNISKTSR